MGNALKTVFENCFEAATSDIWIALLFILLFLSIVFMFFMGIKASKVLNDFFSYFKRK